jgi:DNA-binding XRE family transcriptional regulator
MLCGIAGSDFAPGLLMKNSDKRDRTTELVLSIPRMTLTFSITGSATMAERRTVANAIFLRIESLFGLLNDEDTHCTRGYIWQRDGVWQNWQAEEDDGIRLRQSLQTETPDQKLGFEIRTKRLRKGLSQEMLAALCGMDRSHLSAIEQGKHKPRMKTLIKIRRAITEAAKPINPTNYEGWG